MALGPGSGGPSHIQLFFKEIPDEHKIRHFSQKRKQVLMVLFFNVFYFIPFRETVNKLTHHFWPIPKNNQTYTVHGTGLFDH